MSTRMVLVVPNIEHTFPKNFFSLQPFKLRRGVWKFFGSPQNYSRLARQIPLVESLRSRLAICLPEVFCEKLASSMKDFSFSISVESLESSNFTPCRLCGSPFSNPVSIVPQLTSLYFSLCRVTISLKNNIYKHFHALRTDYTRLQPTSVAGRSQVTPATG